MNVGMNILVVMMSDCNNCIHYIEEPEINYADCYINEDEKYWFGNLDCPSFEEVPDYPIKINGDE